MTRADPHRPTTPAPGADGQAAGLIQLAGDLAHCWRACQAIPVERREGEDDRYLDARERLLALLDARGVDRDAFVQAIS